VSKNGKARAALTLPSDPAWERMKAARRFIGHDDAVQETAHLQRQYRALWSDRMTPSPVDLNQILRTLTAKKIRFVLTGAHAIGGWTGRPRDTRDVDILVKAGQNHARAVKAIRELYPILETRDFTGVTAFFIPGERESVIDVTYPHRPDNEETLNNPVWVKNPDGLKYRIPSLEAALANKYGAMLTPDRHPKKRAQDALDFAWMVEHSMDQGRKPIDLQRLAGLGEMVWPGGGGDELLGLVEQARKGEIPSIVRE
jgi:hypothetical protein